MRKILSIFAIFMTAVALIVMMSLFAGCSAMNKGTLNVVSGSENRELEPLLQEFTRKTGIKINMTYMGSLDIMQELKSGAENYDAVWSASSVWIAMGDEKNILKHEKSISASPVVFGIRKSLAQDLGFVDNDVYMFDILNAIESSRLNFAMTSATQSNSGACAYLGFISAVLNKTTPVEMQDLKEAGLRETIKSLLSGVNRSSGSSDWLKDLIVESGDSLGLDAMVNYESLVISANNELVKQGKEPLYVVYPRDGMTLSDSPLGYVNHGDGKKEENFLKLQEYLLSENVQKKLNDLGRRTGILLNVEKPDLKVWNPEWGLETDKTLSFVTLPSKDVILEALNLYQASLRKSSATVYCLDFSGSMNGEGNRQLVIAMQNIFDQDLASENLLQNSPDDYTLVIAFSDSIIDSKAVCGNSPAEMQELYDWINNLYPNGGTDIYTPVIEGITALDKLDNTRLKSIALMTDGESNSGMVFNEFKKFIGESKSDIPVFPIMFGDASSDQLEDIAELTRAKVFDGRSDIVYAFKQVKGYS